MESKQDRTDKNLKNEANNSKEKIWFCSTITFKAKIKNIKNTFKQKYF